MPPVVEVRGLRELVRSLKRFGEDVNDLKDAHEAVSRMIAARAAERAPHRSGALAASVRGSRQAARAVIRAGSAKVPYAGPIHWGWPARGIAANRFIWDTATDTQDEWLAAYERSIQDLADKVEGM